MNSLVEWDAIVVGGGIAGASVSIHLARSGAKVLLLEKEKAPHHKVCGEFLSGECVPWLEELGIDLDRLEAESIEKFRLISRGQELSVKLPFRAKGLSRKRLDAELLNLAMSVGVSVELGETVSGVEKKERDIYHVKTRSQTHHAKSVFWAAGKLGLNSVVKREEGRPKFLAYKRHLKMSDELYATIDKCIELHIFKGGYGGLSRVEEGLANFCFILNKGLAQKIGKDWQQILSHLSRDNRRLNEIFDDASWQWSRPVAIGNIPYGHVLREEPGFFVLGDQLAVIPSLAGDGMAMALLSAKKAAYHYGEAQKIGESTADAAYRYHQELRDLFTRPVKLGDRLQGLFGRPWAAEIAMKAMRPFPRATETLIWKTRCSTIDTGDLNVHRA